MVAAPARSAFATLSQVPVLKPSVPGFLERTTVAGATLTDTSSSPAR
jgi:hypothetical protein